MSTTPEPDSLDSYGTVELLPEIRTGAYLHPDGKIDWMSASGDWVQLPGGKRSIIGQTFVPDRDLPAHERHWAHDVRDLPSDNGRRQ